MLSGSGGGSAYGKEERMATLEIPRFVLMGSKF